MKSLMAILVIIIGVGIIIKFYNPKSANGSRQSQTVSNGLGQNLIVSDLAIGSGSEAKKGDKLTVDYIGSLENGTKFDSSYDRHSPFEFTLGAGEVIKGWDQALAGMKVKGKRKLTIPPDLGYGNQEVGSIPANSTLIFEVELLEVNENLK